MKLECDVIRDLLPLYAEKLASPASSALVEQHLAECEACRAELEQMEKPVPVQPEPQPDAPLRNIRKTLQKKSIRIAAAAVSGSTVRFWAGVLDGRRKKTPVTAEQAKIWTYNKKGKTRPTSVCWKCRAKNVWLETGRLFLTGANHPFTVRAVRYTFPHIHAALEGLLGTSASDTSITVSGTQLLTVQCADETRYYRDGQQVERFILKKRGWKRRPMFYESEDVVTPEQGVFEKG